MPKLLLIDEGMEVRTAFPRHQHAAWMTIVYVQGSGEVIFDDQHVPFAVGTILCVPPQTPYAENATNGFRSLYFASSDLFPVGTGIQVFTERASRPFHRVACVLLEEARLSPQPGEVQRALFESMAAWLYAWRQRERPQSPAERLRRLLVANTDNPHFELGEAIQTLSTSPAHVRRGFQQSFGMNPRAYLHRSRMEKAKRLLRIGGFSVKQVAHAVGMTDAHYFSRLFHRLVGCWPLDYRRGRGRSDGE